MPAEIRLYKPLFSRAEPDIDENIAAELDAASREILKKCRIEPALAAATTEEAVQFERQGYFCLDPDSIADRLIFNRTVGLRDNWARVRVRA
jgi:glutaminyl-tRNA synthetase